ncbi:Clavaminate synthase-like protein [Pluteus cervinus]|uniref:Clavaminate synthase-like protein n=1 Tax=Pluteus cervinus TaxID=181527 RepID=A0ACD3BD62_9AGAR|nr:Clavaminate synthase-like protein [Pluteus cervinus]
MFLNPAFNASKTLYRSVCRSSRRFSTYTATDTSLRVQSLDRSFSYVWLRDSCQSSPTCIHPTTLQKVHKTSDIPVDIKPIEHGINFQEDGVKIKWTDGHESFFQAAFLKRHSSKSGLFNFHKDVASVPWDTASLSSSNLHTRYSSLQEPASLAAAVQQLLRYGMLIIEGVPNSETDDKTCELRKLSAYFGHIRPTFYGETWDVRNVRNSRNVAYTNLDLGLHQDLLYFEHPPRYQILHALRNRVEGGLSRFVDATFVGYALQKTHPNDFDVLTSTPVAFHYINDGHHLHFEHPTLEIHNGEIQYINYSPPFQAPLPVDTPAEFYPAFKRFTQMLNDESVTWETLLKEGDAVIFDNRRILHARTEFRDIETTGEKGDALEGETTRWLKGCYLEADAVMDRYRVLTTQLEKA